MSKKSCFSEKNYAKNFHFNIFCPYFCPVKSTVLNKQILTKS